MTKITHAVLVETAAMLVGHVWCKIAGIWHITCSMRIGSRPSPLGPGWILVLACPPHEWMYFSPVGDRLRTGTLTDMRKERNRVCRHCRAVARYAERQLIKHWMAKPEATS